MEKFLILTLILLLVEDMMCVDTNAVSDGESHANGDMEKNIFYESRHYGSIF